MLLPVAAVGGDVVRARLLNFSGVAGGAAAASALLDLLLRAGAQALFALIGIALLMQIAGGTEIASWATRGLGIAALALGGFYAVQRFGGARLVERGLGALACRWPATAPSSDIRLHDSLQAIYANRPAIAAAFSLHELAWLLGAFETWIALWLLGVPVSATEAMILESLSQALRAAVFPVPRGLGIQEGGFIALGGLFGIPPEAALALSFVKRVPDLAIGLPGLLAWYWLEMPRLLPIAIAVPPPGPHGLRAVLGANTYRLERTGARLHRLLAPLHPCRHYLLGSVEQLCLILKPRPHLKLKGLGHFGQTNGHAVPKPFSTFD